MACKECVPHKDISGPVRTVGELREVLARLSDSLEVIMLDEKTAPDSIYSGHSIGAVQEIAGAICFKPLALKTTDVVN